MPQRSKIIFRPFSLWTGRQSTAQAPAPTVWDLTILVLLIVIVVLIVSVIYDGGLLTQISDDDAQLRASREETATLQEQISEKAQMKQMYEAEATIAHPDPADRDLQAIGTHVDVSWSLPSRGTGKYVDYVVELVPLEHYLACTETQRDELWCPHSPAHFIASDSQNNSSQIPWGVHKTLGPGRYAWRVAPIPSGTIMSGNEEQFASYPYLSEWSQYGVFTLYGSQLDRIMQTGYVRVGLDLTQQTEFAQRGSNGRVRGAEIDLVRTLIEQCMELDPNRGLEYSEQNCSSYVHSHLTTPSPLPIDEPCKHNRAHLCVIFVPIEKWGAYPDAVKRREIDLFIGTVTRAMYRERSGLRFTSGYFTFHTGLFAHSSDVDQQQAHLNDWLSRDRAVGVIKSSTNEFLLDRLLDEFSPRRTNRLQRFQKHLYDSFPAMEAAMDRGEIDGVLIDDAFVRRLDWSLVKGLPETNSWKEYSRDFLHYNEEQYGIAVSFSDSDPTLYRCIEAALRNPTLHDEFFPSLQEAIKPQYVH